MNRAHPLLAAAVLATLLSACTSYSQTDVARIAGNPKFTTGISAPSLQKPPTRP